MIVDSLARLASASESKLTRTTRVKMLKQPSILNEEKEMNPVESRTSWKDTIMEYLTNRTLQ